jgi:hypothetical protein
MVIAGAGTALALRKRSVGAFAKDRTKRLLVPVLFGMLVIVPPQIYVERIFRGQFHGSYLQFWPSVLELVPYGSRGGSLSWHHLWFVVYLLVYSLALLPLFAWLARPSGQAVFARAEAWLAKGANVLLLFVPLGLGRFLLRQYEETHDLVHDPNTVLFYAQLFLFGHLLGRSTILMQRLVELRWKCLALALGLLAVLLPDGEFFPPVEHLARGAFVWTALLAFLGFARALVKERRPWLAYAQERAYPFYILHQTVIIVVGYCVIGATVGPWLRFAVVLGVSFFVTWALCEIVARIAWLRPLLGMGPMQPAPTRTKHVTATELARADTAS